MVLARSDSNDASPSLLSQAVGEPSADTLQHPWDAFENACQINPQRIAVSCAGSHQAASPHPISQLVSISYTDLHQSAQAFASSLAEKGLTPNSRILVILRNGIEWATVMWAAARISCALVPLGEESSKDASTLDHILQLTKPQAIIVQKPETAAAVDQCLHRQVGLPFPAVKSIIGSAVLETWTPYADLLRSQPSRIPDSYLNREKSDYQPLLLFTSGSTGRPKCCPYSLRTLLNPAADIIEKTKIAETSVACNFLPNSHVLGFLWWYCFMVKGGQVVYNDSVRFSVNDILRMTVVCGCTHLVCMPSVLSNLMKEVPQKGLGLQSILLAGERVSETHLRVCSEIVKCQQVGILYGMTEGIPLGVEVAADWRSLVEAGGVISGSVAKGAMIKICDPLTQSIVQRGQLGELQQGGEQLIPCYLNDGETFVWLPTGDQARMDNDGRVSILGRYKDIINKAGEKYSPATIEEIISLCSGFETAVVPIEDEISGEVIAAIIDSDNQIPVTVIRDAIIAKLPPACVPDHFISLRMLRLSDFPRTASGKIAKRALMAAAKLHISDREVGSSLDGKRAALESTILEIWSRLLSCPASDIDVSKPVHVFADSMLLTKFANRVEKKLGVAIPMNVLVGLESIENHIEYVESHIGREKNESRLPGKQGGGPKGIPPTAASMSFTMGDDELALETKKLVSEVLSPHGYSWSHDVVDVIPAYDVVTVLFPPKRLLSYSFRWVLLTQLHGVNELRRALEATLRNNNMFTSFFTREYCDKFHHNRRQPLHILLETSDKLLTSCVRIDPVGVASVADLKTYLWHDEKLDHAGFPGPLFKANVVHVQETGSAAVVFNGNHTTFDGTTVQLFFEDLDQSLSAPGEDLEPHFPYKAWADTYWQLRDSTEAQISVAWHVQRLSRLCEHKKGLFPPQVAPEWFTGSSAGWQPGPETKTNDYINLNRRALEQVSPVEATMGYHYHSRINTFSTFRLRNPEIRADIIFKAALVLFNVKQTGYHTAMFSNTQGCRDKMPFVPATLEPYLGLNNQLADINGPLFGWVANVISVRNQQETTLEFVRRVQTDQDSLTAHSYAPLADVIERLDDESGLMVPDIIHRQLFNYLPAMVVDDDSDDGTSNPYRSFKIVQEAARSDLGLHWRVWVSGRDASTCHVWLCWDEANCTKAQIMDWTREFGEVLAWLTDEDNEQRPVLSFRDQKQ